MTILHAEKLGFHYQPEQAIFKGLTLTLASGEIHTILGPNGVGKSTLLKCLVGVQPPNEGQITLDDQHLNQLSPRQRARKLAFVPQVNASSTNVSLTVFDYVLLGRTPYQGLLATPTLQDRHQCEQLLAQLSLTAFSQRSFAALSGGQQQLVMIARALLQEPDLIILDEPTSALDLGNQVRVLKLINQLQQQGYGILLTTHDPNLALMLGGAVSLFTTVGGFETGPVQTTLTSEKLTQAYQTPICVTTVAEQQRQICFIASDFSV